MTNPINIHGTAIVIGTSGLLFIGPSGAGKSSLALNCLQAARHAGQFCALIADDQVFVENTSGLTIARRPSTIIDLIEIRYSGIAQIHSIQAAVLYLAIMAVEPQSACRLPPQEEIYALPTGLHLPLLRMARDTVFPLAIIAAMRPDLIHEQVPS